MSKWDLDFGKPKFYWNSSEVSEAEFEQLLEATTKETHALEKEIKHRFGISDDTASAIVYLRTRSRWTIEKELELIQRDRAGRAIPLSDVLSGEF